VKNVIFVFPVLPSSAEAQVISGNRSANKISKSVHRCQSYMKTKVGRFLRHGVVVPASDSLNCLYVQFGKKSVIVDKLIATVKKSRGNRRYSLRSITVPFANFSRAVLLSATRNYFTEFGGIFSIAENFRETTAPTR